LGLAQVWQQKRRYEPDGYDDVRSWVNQLMDNDWEKAIPNWTNLTPSDMCLIWQAFTEQSRA
jgi:hypothetical protein